jgi:hypothetical protein
MTLRLKDTIEGKISNATNADAVPWGGVSGKPSTFTPSSHTHDDRYYTETEMDSKLSGKANSSHTHTKSQITDFPSSMKNPNSLTISLNGTSQGAYDGSAAKSINVTPSSIGAATSGHTHNYAGSSSAGGAATKANGIVVSDTRNDNPAPNDAGFDKSMLTADFKYGSKIGSPTGFKGTYCGVLSLAPWSETSGGHGYQLAFGYADTGHPRLALRGSDLSATSWNNWYKVYTSDDKPTLSELGAAAASHSHTKSQITDFAHTHDDRYYTESEIDTKLSGKAASSHKHAAADITSVNASAITGTIAAANLPSYVDDVLEYAGTSKFPSTGEAGKIYTDTTTNKIYRWGGSSYVVISDTIALGETSSTAYRGDRGKTAYDHSQITSGNPHKVTKSDIGLGSVDNTSDANKSVKYAKSATANNPIKTTGTGAAYGATVDGITALTIGAKFTMVPHTVSTTTAPTLNVNGLGAKNIRMRLTSSTTATIQLTSASFLTANKPVNVVYDGSYWVIDDFAQPDVNGLYGTVPISKGGTGATTAANARKNLGITTAKGTMLSQNADYAEVGQWVDGNPNDENRIGYFVAIDDTTAGSTMVKAKSTSDVRGVTVATPAFSGNCGSDKYDSNGELLKQYDYVACMGLVSVIDNGTCTINKRCMPKDDGTAVPSSNNMGYQVVDRIDDTHILIAVEPSGDMLVRIKEDITNLQNSGITRGTDAPTSSTTGFIYIQTT